MKHEFAFSANTSRLAAGQAALDHLGNRRQFRNIEADTSLIVNVDAGIVGGGLAVGCDLTEGC
jgi:hypothetical protein